MANNSSLQEIGRAVAHLHWGACRGLHRVCTKLHKVCSKFHIACTQFETRCEHVLPLVGGKEHSQVAHLLERLSSVILTISPSRFSFCQLLSITISSWVHVDQLNYRDGPSKGSLGECHNQIIVCSIKRSLIALLPFGREEKSHSKVAGCDQRGKFQWFPEDAESSSSCIMYWTQTAFAKYCSLSGRRLETEF